MFSVARFDSTRVRGARKPKAPAAGTADAAASTPASVLARLNSAAGQRAASTAKRAGSGQSTGATGSNSASRTKKRDRRRTDAGGDAEYPPSAASGRKRPRRARGGDAAQQQQQQQQEAADSGEYGSGEIDGGLAGLPAGTGTHVKFDDAGGASGGGGTGAHRVRRVIDQATQWRSSRKFKGFAGALARKLYGSGDGAIDGTASTSGTAAKPKGAGAGKPPAATTSTDTNAAATAATAAEDSEAWGLAPQLRRVLAGQGVTQFFPIQRMVVPHLLRAQASADPSHCDVCIAAPTGSGKTLSYVLPVVAALQGRTVPRLRALVLVPTRDLVQQVLAVFQAYVAGTDLRVEAAMGHVPFHTESERLRGTGGARGEVCVDILVATPGRLVDHLDDTPGFTLEHLQFLVVDEADRLLSQSYQNWVYRVYESAFQAQARLPGTAANASAALLYGRPRTLRLSERRGRHFSAACGLVPRVMGDAEEAEAGSTQLHRPSCAIRVPLRRIICSATLTNNPQKLAMLALDRPRVFRASDVASVGASTGVAAGAGSGDEADGEAGAGRKRYKTPEGLHEAMVVCDADKKPLVLLQLLQAMGTRRSLVFCSSVEKVHRLTRLLQLYGGLPGRVVEFSANLPQSQRSRVLNWIKKGKVLVVVSSDAAARGIDVPGLSAVMHYDAPPRVKTYIHRVGRTARARTTGLTYTLLEPQQVRHFKDLLRRVDNSYVTKETVSSKDTAAMVERFQLVLDQLKRVLRKESKGRLSTTEPVKAVAGEAAIGTSAGAAGAAHAGASEAGAGGDGSGSSSDSSDSSDSDSSDNSGAKGATANDDSDSDSSDGDSSDSSDTTSGTE